MASMRAACMASDTADTADSADAWPPLQKVLRFPAPFKPTCMCHPPTYLNKLLLGSSDGALQLWNFSSGKCLFQFPGWGSPVTCLEPTPALDVVAAGLQSGAVVLLNIRYDEEVMTFENAAAAQMDAEPKTQTAAAGGSAACTCISFRRALTLARVDWHAKLLLTCVLPGEDATHVPLTPAASRVRARRSGTGPPLMATGGAAGSVAVWHLGDRRLQTVIAAAHRSPLTRLHFFAGEPVLMSAGCDNAIVHWIFDSDDGSARRLRFRSGHAAAPRRLAHYGDEGNVIISAAADQDLRVFSIIQDQQSRELSQVEHQPG
jgi:U3 small nucleolar RNA-associated protein 21